MFSRSGTSRDYPAFVPSTGYGTGPGLMGWNCRHNFYPYFEGISERAYQEAELDGYASKTVTYNGEELSFYEATQKQRSIERKIRYWKRQEGALKAAGLDPSVETAQVQAWQARMRDFVQQTGLKRQGFRERVTSVSPSTQNVPAFLKTYPGTTIDVKGHKIIEDVIESALEELQRQGYDFPKNIKTDLKFFIKYKAVETSPCAYMNGTLYINSHHEMWRDPAGYMKREFENGEFSTNKPEGAIWHEVAHYLHEQRNPGIYLNYRQGGFPDPDQITIAGEVSRYAIDSADEFVAEVFSAQVAGMDEGFTLQVLALFAELGGGI